MAQLISVKLSRFDNSPWGFRLQGGKDFGTPLVVQKVNGGSPAEAAGLRAGDAVIKVNNTDTFNLRHKDAQDVIVRAGNNFEVTIQRGGSTWKPSVTPVSATLPTPKPSSPASNISPVTKTSLAAKKQDGPLIGSGHNFSPKPFLNGNGEAPIKSIVNKQYNSPVGIYSEETIAETLSAQAEVLAGGVLGVNFKKNEKNYNAENSEVFKMVQEADKEPRSPEPVSSRTEFYSSVSHAVGGRATSPRSPTPLGRAMGIGQGQQNLNFHQCSALGDNQHSHLRSEDARPSPDTPVCHNCDKSIVGVFVRIKEKNLHVECFKCSTCGTSLKNVGYYNINNKLYCDIHAKLVARQNPPASGLIPVTIPPGKAPAGTISAALANVGASIPPLAPLSPSLNNHSSPQAFTCNRTNMIDVQDGVQRLRLNENGTTGTVSSMNRVPLNQVNENSIRNGAVENAKTFTSTLIIQTGNEVGSTYNNDEKLFYNNTVNTDFCRDKNQNENANFCQFELTTTFEDPTCTDIIAIAAQPFPTRKQSSHLGASPLSTPVLRPVQAPSTNNIGGPKPFGGAPTAPSLVSTPSLNSGSNTLPRPQSQNASAKREITNNLINDKAFKPVCHSCNSEITRGPFITALGNIWCPDHFVCVNAQCRRPLQDIGFVEEKGQLYCEYCFEQYIAPPCSKCNNKIKGECLNAIGKHFHPECFNCSYCGKLFGNNPFFLEDGLPYCEADWNELFTTKCFSCGFPVEAGDRWVEALSNNYHSQCFNCTMCKKNLEGQSFYAKGGRPFCKNHAR